MESWRQYLNQGQVIPACPLTLFPDGTWSETHQRAVLRYYLAAGAGGIAVGVHSTQFAIRDPKHGLYQPILELAAETISQALPTHRNFVRIAGVCGSTRQAISEAEFAKATGYHAGLLSLTALSDATEDQLIAHCQAVSEVLPVIGFYLQPAVGGKVLPYRFWRRFAQLERLVAIKIAPFDRYFTCDVVRAVVEAGRDDVALYTGNDDNIIVDLLTPYCFADQTRFIVGGLLGQWGVWTRRAVELLSAVHAAKQADTIGTHWLSENARLTDANAAIFDARNGFRGCVPGINEVLRRQGLSPSNRCLDPEETLSPGQAEEIERIIAAYPSLTDDDFVQEHLSEWLC